MIGPELNGEYQEEAFSPKLQQAYLIAQNPVYVVKLQTHFRLYSQDLSEVKYPERYYPDLFSS